MEQEKGKRLSAALEELPEDVGEDRLSCILSVFFSGVLFILIYSRLRLYPFGDNTLLYADGDQYISLYRMLAQAVSSGEGLFYTFRAVLGNGLIPTAAYYAMSPFNLLLLFFPNNLIAGIHFTAFCKHAAAALTMCTLLNACCRGRIPEKAVFSACYAFIGYMSFFAWNLSWMDGVLILPLVCLGVLKLVKEKRIGLYVCSITYAVISNFYIGFMVCIASLLIYAVSLTVLQTDENAGGELRPVIDRLKRSFPLFAFASLTGAGLSCIVLVPAIAGLPAGRKFSLSEILLEMQQNFRPVDFFSMFFTGRMDDWYTNHPMVFFGIIPLLLVTLFFFDKNLSCGKKITSVTLIFLFFFSFWNSAANMIWHGMSTNYSFNYRYSFILSFFLLLLSFDMMTRLKRTRISFTRAGIFLAAFCLWVMNDTQGAFFAKDITRDMFLMVTGLLLMRYLAHGGRLARPALTILLLLMCANVYRNAITVMWPDVRTSVPATTFLREVTETEQALDTIDDPSFYRLEKDYRTGRADASLFGYYGVSSYASTENVPLLIALREFGIGHRWMWGFHTESTPLSTDALLGIKYILSKTPVMQKELDEYALTADGIHVYENKSALPLVMFSEYLPLFYSEDNAFERMNRIWHSFGAEDGSDVFQQVVSVNTQADELFSLSFTVGDEADKPLYLYLDQPAQAIYVYSQTDTHVLTWSEQRHLYYLGTFSRGTAVQVCIYVPEALQQQMRNEALQETTGTQITNIRDQWLDVPQETASPSTVDDVFTNSTAGGVSTGASPVFDLNACLIYAEDTTLIAEIAASVQEKTTSAQVKGTADPSALHGAHVRAVVQADRDGYAVTSIPYDESWRMMLDGIRVSPERYMEHFLAVPVTAGEHTIELYYMPRGFVTGVLLSVLSAVILVLRFLEIRFFFQKRHA